MIKTMTKKNWKCFNYAIIILFLYSGLCLGVQIKVEQNFNLRAISEQYLKNPDLWVDILRVNNLKTLDDLHPGMVLKIPVSAIISLNTLGEQSRHKISQAARLHGRIFARQDLDAAIQAANQGVKKRDQGAWDAARELFEKSIQRAHKVIKICKQKQNVPAQAVIQHRYGQVQHLKVAANAWQSARLDTILLEGEKVRTLSNSYADILFRDDNRLHLSANAQILIRKLRENLLDDHGDTKLNLIQGDIMALLGSNHQNNLKIETPGIKTKINSRRFRVKQDQNKASFANYDGEIEISSAGAIVTLKEFQGSIVHANQKPGPAQALLPPPKLLKPNLKGHEQVYGLFKFKWTSVKGAGHYLLELAHDSNFTDIIYSHRFNNTQAQFPSHHTGLSLYWHILAVTADGMPGRPSQSRAIRVVRDNTPPFLSLRSPLEGTTVLKEQITVIGFTEKGVIVTIGKEQIKMDSNNSFSKNFSLDQGSNTIKIKATDSAGNITSMDRKVIRGQKQEFVLTFPHLIVTNQQRFILNGTTIPHAEVMVTSKTGHFKTAVHSDEQGKFSLNLVINGVLEEFNLNVKAPGREVKEDYFKVEIDRKPPQIYFDQPLAQAVAKKIITLKGGIKEGISLTFNHQPMVLSQGRFHKKIKLHAGLNSLNFSAVDAAGNIAVLKKEIIFDNQPPQYQSHQFSQLKVKGGETLVLTLKAKDQTSLKKIARFTLMVGTFVLKGHLIRDDIQPQKYKTSIRIPAKIKGVVKLKSVLLSDYLGNEKLREL